MKWLKAIIMTAVLVAGCSMLMLGCEQNDMKSCNKDANKTCCCAKTCDASGKCACTCDTCAKAGGCKDCKCGCKCCTPKEDGKCCDMPAPGCCK